MSAEPSNYSLPKPCDKEVVVMQVIRTTNHVRGTGEKDSPYRRITQYWTLDGDFLAEVDPCRTSTSEAVK